MHDNTLQCGVCGPHRQTRSMVPVASWCRTGHMGRHAPDAPLIAPTRSQRLQPHLSRSGLAYGPGPPASGHRDYPQRHLAPAPSAAHRQLRLHRASSTLPVDSRSASPKLGPQAEQRRAESCSDLTPRPVLAQPGAGYSVHVDRLPRRVHWCIR